VTKAANALRGRAGQLLCGAIAGPLFTVAFTAIGATRAGYDWERLPVSSLAIGRHGWLQRTNFVVAGVLYSCAGGGLRRSASPRIGPRAVPALVTAVGVGLIGSGMFVTDPVGGFPPGTPDGAGLDGAGSGTTAPTLAGRLHNLFAIPIFAGIPVAAMASAATALRNRDYQWAGFSAASGLAMVGSFVMFGSAFGNGSRLADNGGIFQRLSIACGCGWLTALSIRALPRKAGVPLSRRRRGWQ
jgi:Protein of unknown function (DUF998)